MRQDIEASVIGGLLIGGLTPTASDVLATLEPEAFSIPLYRKAFEVIRKQARNRNLIDALMVAEACGEEHFTSILMTSKNCPSAANLKGYAGMVADNYHRRLVLEIMDEMREPIQSGTIDASSQAMDELVKRLSAIRKPRDEVKPVRLSETVLSLLPSCRQSSPLVLLTVGESLKKLRLISPKRYQKHCALLLILLSRKCNWKTSSQLPHLKLSLPIALARPAGF